MADELSTAAPIQPANAPAAQSERSGDLPFAQSLKVAEFIELAEGGGKPGDPGMKEVVELEVMGRVFPGVHEYPIATASPHPFAQHIDGFVIRHLEKPSRAHTNIGPSFPERDSKLLNQVFEIIPDEILLVRDTPRNVG